MTCINMFQPWADAVISGKIPILIRKFSVSIRARVGICSTSGMDGIFLRFMDINDFERSVELLDFNKVIGTILIDDCIPVKYSDYESILSKYLSKEQIQFYPKHLIPKKERLYLWILKDPERFDNPSTPISKGFIWGKFSYDSSRKIVHENIGEYWRMVSDNYIIQMNRKMVKNDGD